MIFYRFMMYNSMPNKPFFKLCGDMQFSTLWISSLKKKKQPHILTFTISCENTKERSLRKGRALHLVKHWLNVWNKNPVDDFD